MSQEQLEYWNRVGYRVHLVTQDNQPFGSERRCCELCGVMVWPAMQGANTPAHATSREDFEQWGNQRCDLFDAAIDKERQ